jgi:hypothetical protein
MKQLMRGYEIDPMAIHNGLGADPFLQPDWQGRRREETQDAPNPGGDLAELVLRVPDGDGGGAVPKGGRDAHHVRCPSCGDLFELFAAGWCDHGPPRPSKLCPHCGVCVCLDANYSDRRFWREAPPAFQRHGIRELFVRYL